MAAKYILAGLAAVFLALGALRLVAGTPAPQARTWLLLGAIFGVVSAWLFLQA